jgi:twitching motility protein PilT
MQIDDLLRIAVERKASDLHLKVGNFPYLRVDGVLTPLSELKRLTAEDMLNMAFSMMTNRQKQKFKESAELDLAYGVAGLGRFRVNVFQQRGNVGMVLRVVPTKIRSFEELNLPRVIYKICEERRGMVLVTGTTGSGKSTTLASMIDRINATRTDHIITIEDPIEYLHRDKKGIVNQREVEVDTHNFSVALRAALRQDPDVILVGEMRDLETISTALLAAETGHLVFYAAHLGRGGNYPAHHCGLPAAGAEANPPPACQHPEGSAVATPGAQERRSRPRPRRGNPDCHRLRARLHHQPG